MNKLARGVLVSTHNLSLHIEIVHQPVLGHELLDALHRDQLAYEIPQVVALIYQPQEGKWLRRLGGCTDPQVTAAFGFLVAVFAAAVAAVISVDAYVVHHTSHAVREHRHNVVGVTARRKVRGGALLMVQIGP